MAERGRPPRPAARLRPPGWVTALGLLLVLGEVAGGIAALAAGGSGPGHPHAARARPHATSSPAAPASPGPARTVVLRVDGGYSGCAPVSGCGNDEGPDEVLYQAPTGRQWWYPRSVPFTKTVQVPADEFVKFNAYPGSQAWARCTISVDGVILSQVTTRTLGGIAACRTEIPPPGTPSSGGMRTVVLEVDNAYSRDSATYGTPTEAGRFDESAGTPPPDTRGYWQRPYRFTKTVPVRPGGSVTIRTLTGYIGSFTPSCSISVDGRVLSQVVVEGIWSKGTCRAVIP